MTGLLDWVQALGALALVLGLAGLLAHLARRSGLAQRQAGGGRLAVQSSLALDARRRLLLLRIDGRECAVLTAPGGDTLLGWLPEQQP
jgi:flagellar protein FliO/FliZ